MNAISVLMIYTTQFSLQNHRLNVYENYNHAQGLVINHTYRTTIQHNIKDSDTTDRIICKHQSSHLNHHKNSNTHQTETTTQHSIIPINKQNLIHFQHKTRSQI